MTKPIKKWGYAPRNPDLTEADRDANIEAARGLVAAMGGVVGMKVAGVGFQQLSYIIEADPNDDLSGLRLLAERMVDGPYLPCEVYGEDDLIAPATARQWLVGTGRAAVSPEGELIAIDADHVTQTGMLIAGGEESLRLSDAYMAVTDSQSPLDSQLLAEMGWAINETYGYPPTTY